jgi:membrane protease YdiL (CAAX protease family)
MLIAQGVPLLGVAWFLRWKYKSSGHLLPALLEGSFGSSALVGIVAGLVMAGFGTLHAIVATALFGKASTEAMEELMRQLLAATGDPAVLSGLVICIAILVPICEEFFFRGALFSSVRSGQSARAAAITSSVLFAVAHLNPMMFTYYLVFGFTMCWLLTRTRTIVAPMAAHITVNSTATIAMLLSSSTGN